MKRFQTKFYEVQKHMILEIKDKDIIVETIIYDTLFLNYTKFELIEFLLPEILHYQEVNNCIVDFTGILEGILKLKGGE